MSLFPKPLNKIIEPLTRPLFRSRGLAGTELLTDWRRIAGTSLADHTIPEKLSFAPGKKVGGTLTIAVENGFALDLQHMQPVILERINMYFGYQAVARILISHNFPKPAGTPPLAKLSGHPALHEAAVHDADNVADPELKEALQSLAKTLSRQYN